MKKLLLTLFIIFSINIVNAQNQKDSTENDMYEMSLEDLINMEVSVATKKATSMRETPSVVTVINKEDIINTGARDLADILSILVPGFGFGVDVEGAVGIGFRGIWGYEGKILLMVDGIECNEDMFSNTLVGNHYLADNIEKIEIIRGPGSSIYGGYAELGVINIITKNSEQNGAYISKVYSQMQERYSHNNVIFGVGKTYKDFSFSLNGNWAKGNRTERDMVDYDSLNQSLSGKSAINGHNLNLNVKYKDLDIRFIKDYYELEHITLWGSHYTEGNILKNSWDSYLTQISYNFKVNDKLTIIPKFNYKFQSPWKLDIPDSSYLYVNTKKAIKTTEGITLIYDFPIENNSFINNINFVGGAEYYENYLLLADQIKDYEETFKNGKSKIGYNCLSTYGQLMITSPIVNLTFGGRYDMSDVYESSFVPRIGITKAFGNFHVKALYSQAFRLPGTVSSNRTLDSVSIKPEKVQDFEVELGYKISNNQYIGINMYKVSFNDVIAYLSDPQTGIGSYTNSKDKFGTQGLEAEYKFISKIANVSLNYAFYMVSENKFDTYKVPNFSDAFLAFPQHRINMHANIFLNNYIIINPSASFYGENYGITRKDDDNTYLIKYSNKIVANCFVRTKEVVKGLDFSIGVHNIMDTKMEYIQPYDGGHAPLPGLSRAYMIRMTYQVKY